MRKYLGLLLGLLLVCNPAFAANPGWSGQSQTSNLYPSVIQAPNNLITDLGSSKALIEVGNGDILSNSSFEHKTLATSAGGSWTLSAGTPSVESTIVRHGKKSLKVVLSAQTLSLYQSSTLYASQLAGSKVQGNGKLSVYWVPSVAGTPLYLCPYLANVHITSNFAASCQTINDSSVWVDVSMAMTPGGTANGVELVSNGAVSGTLYADNGGFELGKTVQQNSAPRTATATYASAVNCAWTNSGTSAFTSVVDTDCPTPTLSGIASAPSTKVPGIVLPAGTGPVIDFNINGYFRGDRVTATNVGCAFDLYDGTNFYPLNFMAVSGASGSEALSTTQLGTRVVLANPLTVDTTYQVRIYANSATSVCQIGNDTAALTGIAGEANFQIAATSYATNSTYSSVNADTDWATCNFSTLVWSGMGTVTPSLYCKRQGGDLLMRGYVLAGTSTASTVQMPLPTWNGVQLTIKNSSTPAQQLGATAILNNNSANSTREATIFIKPGLTYLTMGYIYDAGTQNPFTEIVGTTVFGGGSAISYETMHIPIEGWEQSNVMVAKISGLESCTDSYACTDVYSAFITGVTPTVLKPNVPGWITGCTASADTFTCNLNTSKLNLTDRLNCTVTPEGGGRTMIYAPSSTSSQILVKEYVTSTGANAIDTGFTLTCQKGADYVGKTAMAVASDQNVRAIGSVGADIQSVFFGSSADCSTVCSTGTCTICNKVGSKITSVSWNAGAGAYLLNGIDGSKYNCTGSGLSTTAYVPIIHFRSAVTTSATIQAASGGTGQNVSYASVLCMGVP